MGANESMQAELPRTSHLNSSVQVPTKKVPTVFRWKYGGHQVCVAGSWNQWENRLPMSRSEEYFTVLELPPGKHFFKFVVDGVWHINPDFPTACDDQGNRNNYIEVAWTSPPLQNDNDEDEGGSDDEYFQHEVTFREDKRNPPTLPPFLAAGKPSGGSGSGSGAALPSTGSASSLQRQSSSASQRSSNSSSFGASSQQLFSSSSDRVVVVQPGQTVSSHFVSDASLQQQEESTAALSGSQPSCSLLFGTSPASTPPHSAVGGCALPVPRHVQINHVFFDEAHEHGVGLGIQCRFKDKFTTVMFFQASKQSVA